MGFYALNYKEDFMGRIIEADRSIIPACDVGLEQFKDIVRDTHESPAIGAYKLGFTVLPNGLLAYVETARRYTEKPLIYDHQKAATDVPDTGSNFAASMRDCGIDAAILFPRDDDFATQYRWTRELQDNGIGVIVGGELTSRLPTPATDRIYQYAVGQDVTNFVVPGNKPGRVEHYRQMMERSFKIEPTFFAPGFVAQGGKISDAGQAAGERWHAIVGRAITRAEDYQRAVEELASQL